nr:DUF1565 domain-containing protein [Fortiea contorta]
MSPTLDQKPLGDRTISQVNVLFVNPSVGDDTRGNGSEQTPVKTITQALRLATAKTVIMLSPGTYSVQTGEVFPLILKAGVSIQGDVGNQGKGINIRGGGDYLSRSFGNQNVAIVGVHQAKLSGVTITNSNPRGYGLWIESSNLEVTANTFTDNTQDGVSITGNAAPTIRQNYFYRNGANGITIGGNSSAQVRENIFQETGFGINITQNAAPIIVGNQIKSNRSGIVVQSQARPILRSNLIQGSKEDGVVAIAQAQPDLGTATEPGGNQFQGNGRYDINASAAKQVITAAGNTIANNRIAGKVELRASASLVARNPLPLPNPTLQQIPVNGEIVFSAPGIAETANNTKPTAASRPLPSAVAGFPTPNLPQLNYVQIDTKSIEYTPPSPAQPPLPRLAANSVNNSPRQLPPVATSVLPVPSSQIPMGNTRNMEKLPVTETYSPRSYGGALPNTTPSRTDVRYRVLVDVATERDQELVRYLVPGAFSTVSRGRSVMQAGVFSNQYNADGMMRTLNSNGLKAIIELLN